MTSEETAKILLTLTGIFTNFRPNALTAPMWLRLLRDVPFPQVLSALDTYIGSGKEFAPTPGQLIEIMRERAKPSADRVTADEAWAMAVSAAQVGSLAGLTHQRTLSAIEQVGFKRIRYADEMAELPFVRRDFISAYETSAERDSDARAALPLAGEVKMMVSTLANQKLLQ